MSREEMEKAVRAEVATVLDPDIRMSLMELGLIYGVEIDENNNVFIAMTLTSMACPAGPYLQNMVAEAARRVEGVAEVQVEIVWEPRWDPREMATEEVQARLGLL